MKETPRVAVNRLTVRGACRADALHAPTVGPEEIVAARPSIPTVLAPATDELKSAHSVNLFSRKRHLFVTC